MLFSIDRLYHKWHLYVTKDEKGTYIVGLVCSDRILLAKGGLIVTNSNNYSFGNHFFKVLVQIPYSYLKQLSSEVLFHATNKHSLVLCISDTSISLGLGDRCAYLV